MARGGMCKAVQKQERVSERGNKRGSERERVDKRWWE